IYYAFRWRFLPLDVQDVSVLEQIIIIVYSVFLYLESIQFHKCFNLFIIRSTASLIGTEGGDSCGNSMSLETPECDMGWKANILLARGSSHARGKRPPAVEINSFSSYPKNTHLLFILAPKGFLDIPLICPGRRALEIWGSARGKHM